VVDVPHVFPHPYSQPQGKEEILPIKMQKVLEKPKCLEK